jgi:uncharacterized membrane protein
LRQRTGNLYIGDAITVTLIAVAERYRVRGDEMLAISIYGLPAHPLVVHLAVVLVPLAATATIAVGWNARWRHRYYLPIALVAIIGAVGAFLAQQTGGSLRRALRQAGKHVGNHPQQGNVAFWTAALLAIVCVLLYLYDTYGDRLRSQWGIVDRYRLPVDENLVLYMIAVPIAVLALVFMVLAGHSGATLVWKTAGSVTPSAGG